jgi:hypothetical protein
MARILPYGGGYARSYPAVGLAPLGRAVRGDLDRTRHRRAATGPADRKHPLTSSEFGKSARTNVLKLIVARPGSVLPGYTTVARAAEVLHLAPRSVRDLIYSGRLPSSRLGRRHYVRASDLEVERRRRLGLPLPVRRRSARPSRISARREERAVERRHVDPVLRRQRAVERAEVVRHWAERHTPSGPLVPFSPIVAEEAMVCASCGRGIRVNQRVLEAGETGDRLCLTCGRRALMQWADRRKLEAAAARRLAQDLGGAGDPQVTRVA